MTDHRAIFALLVVLAILLLLRIVQRWHADADNPFNFFDLLMENGRASKGAFVLIGSFVATTCFFLYYTATGRMTEGYFALYAGAWIAPTVTRLIKAAPPEAPPRESAA